MGGGGTNQTCGGDRSQDTPNGKRGRTNGHPVRVLESSLLAGLPLLALALFLSKPFHIDDVLFLRMGDLLSWTILDDARGRVEFLGVVYENLSAFESTHPILIPFFLKILNACSTPVGSPVWFFHLAFLVFPLLIFVFARQLARLGGLSIQSTWFLVFSPVFFVNATNLMTDVPMLAFWIGAISLSICYCETGQKRWRWLASVFLFLALMTSYQSMALLPLLGFYLFCQRRAMSDYLCVLGLPFLVFLAFLGGVYKVSGFFPFVSSSIDYNIATEVRSGMGWMHYLHKALGSLVFLGLGLAFATPILLLSLARRRLLEHLVFASILSFTLFHLGRKNGEFVGYLDGEILALRCLLFLGSLWSFQVVARFVDGFRVFLRHRTWSSYLLLPTLWYLGVIAYNIAFLPYATARYVLPAIPAALILLFNHPRYRPNLWREASMIALSALLALVMAAADYRQADADRLLAQRVLKRVGPDQMLWFSDDAGLNRYLKAGGAKYLPKDRIAVNAGDYVLVTRGLIHPQVLESLSLVEHYQVPSWMGLTLFDTTARAGFYRSLDGLLPMAPAATVRSASLFRANRFLLDLPHARREVLSNPDYVGRRVFHLPHGQQRTVLFMHPDARLSFVLDLRIPMLLSGRFMTDPGNWDQAGDGVVGRILAQLDGETRLLWESYVDGKSRVTDRGGVDFLVPLPHIVTALKFEVGPGPAGDYRFDGCGWADLALTPDPGSTQGR